MKRLPERFEKEVLEPVGISWKEDIQEITRDGTKPERKSYYAQLYDTIGTAKYSKVLSDYEIAARGLEAILDENTSIGMKHSSKKYRFMRFKDIFSPDFAIYIEDKDYNECIFKAIREVYK